jgi:hypothetical protein
MDEAVRYPTQGEAQAEVDELHRGLLAQLGGTLEVKEVGHE